MQTATHNSRNDLTKYNRFSISYTESKPIFKSCRN